MQCRLASATAIACVALPHRRQWSRDSEHPCHLSAVEEAGPMLVSGPASGDSFNLMYLVLQTH